MAVIMRSAAVLGGGAIPSGGFSSMWWSPSAAGGSTADATEILARFRLFWATVAGAMTTGVTVTFDPICIAVEDSTGVLTGSFAGTQPASVTGTAAGDPLPYQTQGLLRLFTSTVVGGRRLRGRLFVPAPPESLSTSGSGPTTAYQTSVDAGGDSMLVTITTPSDPVVWHRPVGGAGGSSGLVTSTAASPTWAVLRSRRS